MTLEEWEELTPSKTRKKFDANILWTISKLRHAKLLENTRLGEFKITQRGLDVLKQNPEKINERFLRQFPEYRKFVRAGDYSSTEPKTNTKKSPLEEFEEICQKLTNLWAEEILDLIKSCDSATFERLVIHLVVKMGYGGTVNDAGKTVRYGDGCVDGVIKGDELGFGEIYIRAKNQRSKIGRSEIQEFVGMLDGKRIRKGIFITTGGFTDEALNNADNITNKTIRLIDGGGLGQYMLNYNLGVSTTDIFEIKRINSDFFDPSKKT